jgi:hypothetical protein
MKNSREIANRFREVLLSGTWVANTNYKDQLAKMDWQMAVATVGNLNTIAVLAQHVHYYIDGINNVLKGGTLDIRDKFSFDFPEIASQKHWEEFLERLWADAESFASLVEIMPDEKLDSFFADEKYGSCRRNIDAMTEHAYYHLGQIVLIKKMLDQQ